MLGLGLKPRNMNGASVLPEIATADNFNASARVAGPDPSPGLGLAKPAALPASPSQPVDAPPVPSPADMPPPAASAPSAPAQKPLIDYKTNPLGAIGLVLSSVAAGMRGDPSPVAALQKQQLEEQAMAYKQADFGLQSMEAFTKILDKNDPSAWPAIADHFQSMFGKMVPVNFKALGESIQKGEIDNATGLLQTIKGAGFPPNILAGTVKPDGSLNIPIIKKLAGIADEIQKAKLSRLTPEEIATNAAATAAGTKAGGKTPADLAADAAAVAAATQKTPAQLEADAAATARGTKAGNPDKTPAQIEAEAAARARGEAAGSGAGEKMTDAQATAALYADRASQAEAVLTDVAHVGTNYWQHVRASSPGGNYLVSPEYQKFDQAKRNFVTAVLRKESGAVISPEEMKQADQQYFPQPGDDSKVMDQKAANRKTAIDGLGRAAGPAYGKTKPDPLGIR